MDPKEAESYGVFLDSKSRGLSPQDTIENLLKSIERLKDEQNEKRCRTCRHWVINPDIDCRNCAILAAELEQAYARPGKDFACVYWAKEEQLSRCEAAEARVEVLEEALTLAAEDHNLLDKDPMMTPDDFYDEWTQRAKESLASAAEPKEK